MVIGRIVLGLAVGGASTVVPVFLAELAPYEIRGSLAGRNELMIVIGQLAAFVVSAIIGNIWGEQHGVWRIMLSVAALPALALLIGMLRMPESPRWLIANGRTADAEAVLRTIRNTDRAVAEVADVAHLAEEEQQIEFLRALHEVDPEMMINIEHEDTELGRVEGIAAAAEVLKAADAALQASLPG